jgi:hypothetical protein
LHATGVGLDEAAGGDRQVEAIEQLVRAGPGGGAEPVQASLQDEVLPAGGHRVAAGPLRYDADRAPYLVGPAQYVDARHGRGALVGAGQGGEDLDGGGLAGAVRAQQAEHGAARDGDVEPVEGTDALRLAPRRIGLDEAACLDGVPRR